MYAPPSSPQSIGGVLDDALRLFRASYGRCWAFAVIPGLILLICESAVGVPRIATTGGLRALATLAHSPLLLLFDLLSILLWLIFQGAVLARQLTMMRDGESDTVGVALASSLRHFPATLVGAILVFLAMVGCAIPIAIVGAIFLAAGGLSAGAGLGLVLLVIVLMIPDIWLWGRLQLWFAAAFVEDAGPAEALGSSWRLTKSRWWRGAAIFTVAAIILIVLSIVFTLIGGLIAALIHVNLVGRAAVVQVFSLGSSTITYTFYGSVWLAMYHDFKLRREGGDLASRAGALSGAS